MPKLQYNGSITQTVFNNSTVKDYIGTPLNFILQKVSWQQGVNPKLIGLTLSDLVKDPFYTLSYTVTISITGTQYYNDSSYPTTDISLSVNGGTKFNRTYQPSAPGSLGHANYDVNDNLSIPSYPVMIETKVYNKCHSGLPGCVTYAASGYTLILILNIQLIADCTGSNLDNQFCSQYCMTNAQQCISDYIGYCLPRSTNMPITTSESCQNFISDYIEDYKPLGEIDVPLSQYCQSKYKGFGDLFSSNNELDKSLCACHMASQDYTNFEQQLVKLYPGFGNLGLVNQCLLPECASSQYKSVVTTAKCNLPQCINIATFYNDGTFDNSTVNINQEGKCATVINPTPTPYPTPPRPTPSPTPPPFPTPTPAPGPRKNYIYIIIGIVILLIIMLIVSLVIFLMKGKQHQASP